MEHGIASGVLVEVFLFVGLAIIMYGMGMSLTGDDFRRVARMPRSVAAGLAAQILALPVLAMGVAYVFHEYFGFEPVLVLGLLLLAAVPGGPTSNMITFLARADAALSVTLTSIVSLASVLTTPLSFLAMTWILFGAGEAVRVSFLQMAGIVLLIIAIPILLGMATRRARPALARRAARPVRIGSILIFAVIVTGIILANADDFWSLAAESVPAVLTLNALALAAGLLVGWAARLPRDQRRAIAVEVGFQNGTVAIGLAILQLESARAAIVPGFYGLVMFATGGLLAWWWARDTARREAHVLRAPDAAVPFAPLVSVRRTE